MQKNIIDFTVYKEKEGGFFIVSNKYVNIFTGCDNEKDILKLAIDVTELMFFDKEIKTEKEKCKLPVYKTFSLFFDEKTEKAILLEK